MTNSEKAFKMCVKLNEGGVMALNSEELNEYSSMLIKYAQMGVKRLYNCIINPFFENEYIVAYDLECERGIDLGKCTPYRNNRKEKNRKPTNPQDRHGLKIRYCGGGITEVTKMYDGEPVKTTIHKH